MCPTDLTSIRHIASIVHPTLPEGDHIVTERISLFPSGCWTLANEIDDQILGYAISHPITHNRPPPLDSPLVTIPAEADTYYIHDLALLPEARGAGYAAEAVRIMLQVAAEGRWRRTCLISVYGTVPFWERFGFKALLDRELGDELTRKLKGYGESAVYMERVKDLRLR